MLVTLERLRVDDSDLLLRWRRDPEVARWMYTTHTIAEEEHRAWMARVVVNDIVDYWVIKGDDVAVGTVNLSPGPHHSACRDWGIYIGEPSARGTGIAECAMALSLDFAFDVRNSHKVSCEAMAHNDRALAMYERVGMKREGLLREQVFKEDSWSDVVVLGCLKLYWDNHRDRCFARCADRGLSWMPAR
jgi:UDP-4-amino-4,6-dideoxy-N-acetyl-beta-L-altrosamine N-acetyltransferase